MSIVAGVVGCCEVVDGGFVPFIVMLMGGEEEVDFVLREEFGEVLQFKPVVGAHGVCGIATVHRVMGDDDDPGYLFSVGVGFL